MAVRTKHLPQIGEVRFYKRRGTRSITIALKPGFVRVNMPYSTPFYLAEKFIAKKQAWIIEHRPPISLPYDGMSVGKLHRLQIEPQRQKSSIKDGVIYAPHNPQLIQRASRKALMQEAEQLITPMLESLSALSGLTYTQLAFKPMASRWGSCSAKGKITLNIALLNLPWQLIEYILVHELCHTQELNHSAAFWELVAAHCPDYKPRRKLLRQQSPKYI